MYIVRKQMRNPLHMLEYDILILEINFSFHTVNVTAGEFRFHISFMDEFTSVTNLFILLRQLVNGLLYFRNIVSCSCWMFSKIILVSSLTPEKKSSTRTYCTDGDFGQYSIQERSVMSYFALGGVVVSEFVNESDQEIESYRRCSQLLFCEKLIGSSINFCNICRDYIWSQQSFDKVDSRNYTR